MLLVEPLLERSGVEGDDQVATLDLGAVGGQFQDAKFAGVRRRGERLRTQRLDLTANRRPVLERAARDFDGLEVLRATGPAERPPGADHDEHDDDEPGQGTTGGTAARHDRESRETSTRSPCETPFVMTASDGVRAPI